MACGRSEGFIEAKATLARLSDLTHHSSSSSISTTTLSFTKLLVPFFQLVLPVGR